MAASGGTQALVATFAFGAVALAAFGASVLFIRGSGKSLFRDGLRLVLVVFFVTAALWSIMGFAATLIYAPATTPCQVLVSFAAAFDQLARIALEQFLVWATKPGQTKPGQEPSSGTFILQALILLRFLLGAVLVGVQRPQFYPACVASNLLLPLGIATLAADALFVAILFMRQIAAGLLQKERRASPDYARTRSLSLATAAFGVWLSMSIPMMLGIKSFALAVRTVVPAAGLLVQLGIIVLCKNSLIIAMPSMPELDSPSPTSRPAHQIAAGVTAARSRGQDTISQPQLQEYSNLSPPSSLKPGSSGGKTLPIINRPSPGQTERGMGGVPVQGQLFPPTRASTAPIIMQKPAKKTLKKDGKIVISKPVIRESSGNNITRNIATVDLATAAKNDRERRAMQPGAPTKAQTVVAAQQSFIKNPQTFRRKEVASPAAANAAEAKRTAAALLAPDATSTAAQVSPGIDDVRRRSPRPALDQVPEAPSRSSVPITHVAAAMISPPSRSPRRPSTVSSQQKASARAPPIPVQNPKRRSSKSPLRDSSDTQVFIDPNTPPVIPSPLRQQTPKWPSSGDVGSPLVPRVKPLPMPISKTPPGSAPVNPTDTRVSPVSRGGSVKHDIRPSRQRPQSPLPDNPGASKTPVQMRPTVGIPLNPKSRHAQAPTNGSSDMAYTVMFVNGIQNANAEYEYGKQSRSLLDIAEATRDSVVHRPRPIPRKSAIYKPDFSVKLSPSVYRHRRSRSGGSIELMRSSIESGSEMLSSIPSFPQPPRSASAVMVQSFNKGTDETVVQAVFPTTSPENNAQTSSTERNGLDTSTNTAPSTNCSSGKFHNESRRQSSPLLPASELRHLSMAPAGYHRLLSGTTVVAAPPTTMPGTSLYMDEVDPVEGDGRETVVVMLDTASEGSYSARSGRDSNSAPKTASWHRRVGDICPTFSVRKAGGRSPRRVPPPTPLLFSKSTRSVLVAETQPSPLESPQHALDEIQEQLRRLETADQNEEAEAEAHDEHRRTLLQNIEAEMGLQESHWFQIRQELAGRSPSSTCRWSQPRTQIQTPASGDLNLASPAPSPNKNAPTQSESESGWSGDAPVMYGASVAGPAPWRPQQDRPADMNLLELPRSPLGASAAARRRLRQSGGGVSITSDDGSVGLGFVGAGGVESRTEPGTPSTPSAPSSPAQNKRLLSANIRTVAHRLGSPTPPDTDESDGEPVENADLHLIESPSFVSGLSPAAGPLHGLTRDPAAASAYQWAYQTADQTAYQPVSHWSIGSDATSVASQAVRSPEFTYEAVTSPSHPETLPGNSNLDSPALILDSYKEDSPLALDNSGSNISSFSSPAPPKEIPRRTLTQRPPRKSKRITLLPDILESPKPLEDKRGTLGIFQFPWGETSDIATLQPQRFACMPMPGTMASGAPLAPAPVLESQSYPTSFFDHYDEEDARSAAADSDGSSGGYSDDDEEFDESTLWEIANMLKSDKIPSRDSLFPDYDEERPPSRAGFTVAATQERSAGTDKPLPPLPQGPSLWVGKPKFARVIKERSWMDLPERKVWKAMVDETSPTLRAPPRVAEATPIQSSSLWKPSQKVVEEPKKETSWLWEQPQQRLTQQAGQTQPPKFAPKAPKPAQLWSAPVIIPPVPKGLPQTAESWNKYLTTKIQPVRVRPRAAKETTIQSSSLWAPSTQEPEPISNLSQPSPRTPTVSKTRLWSQPPKLPEEQTEGLFSLSHIRYNYRTSPNKPAALETKRTLRIDTRPLPSLKHKAPWSRAAVSHILNPPPPQNWLALSLHQQQLFPPRAESDTSSDSDVSDASSVRSEETGTSTLASSATFRSQASRKKRAAAAAEREGLDNALREVLASQPTTAAPPDNKLFFDVTTSHPVFAVDVLHITSDTCHPAATGYLHSVINGAPRPRRHVSKRGASRRD